MRSSIANMGWRASWQMGCRHTVPHALDENSSASAHTLVHGVAGIVPECSLFCYFGTLAENITQIASGQAVPHGTSTYVLFGVTFLTVVICATWATFIVRCVPATGSA